MCGGSLRSGDPLHTVRRISKDTRTIEPGDLYLGLRGDNHDGNAFASDAAARGAVAAILDHPQAAKDLPADYAIIEVKDSLVALQKLAGAWRDRLALKVVCITGSSGKTSTKEFTAAVLAMRYRVVKTQGNLNNHIGLPLSILSASTSDDAAVWEIGMNHPGEIAPLAALARPQIGIITNIGVAHIEYMQSREAIAREKGELFKALSASGTAILPAEDDFKDFLASTTPARLITAGLAQGDITASDIKAGTETMTFTIHAEGEEMRATLHAHGEHMVHNALLAVAAGLECGLSLEECVEGLGNARLTGGRLSLRTIHDVTIIDDTYNANPDSMEAALATARQIPGSGKRLAVLGRMGELGLYEQEGYQRVGRAAARALDTLIAVGPETAPLSHMARAEGLQDVHETANTDEAALLLRRLAHKGDIVLIKGSRSAGMERVIHHFEN